MKEYENKLYESGIKLIAGVDEVGRGPLAGPVVAAAVILAPDFFDIRINDSKKLTEKRRNELFSLIEEHAISIGIGVVNEKVIDEINIYEATKIAMKEAINNLSITPEHVLIDAMKLDIEIPSTSIIKGDAKSESIAAASIIAKVTRDRMMYELDKIHPEYDFKNNKGYGTKKHINAINNYGIIDEHRKTFSPVSEHM
jgi:ribonuclease HII